MSPRKTAALLGLLLAPAACGEAPPPPAAPAVATAAPSAAPSETAYVEPPQAPMPSLRTGALAPIEHPDPIEGTVLSRHLGDALETLEVKLVFPQNPGAGSFPQLTAVSVDGAAGPYSFVEARHVWTGNNDDATVWIRRPHDAAGKPLTGDLFAPSGTTWGLGTAGHHFHLHVADTGKAKSDPKVIGRWAEALAQNLGTNPWQPSAWSAFAAPRLRAVFVPPPPKPKQPARGRGVQSTPPPRLAEGEIARLMETTTGAASIQEALQNDRGLFLAESKEKSSVPIASLAGPKLAAHPWQQMIADLGAAPPPAEPLAAATPAEFYFLRVRGLTVALRLADELDAWGTPVATHLDRRSDERDLGVRYETALGLDRGPLTRSLGPDVVADLAVVGSDPYFREGTDVTLIFRVKNRTLFDAGLATSLAARGTAHGGLAGSKITHDGTDITVARSPDGAVSQHRATAGDLEIVSTSPVAIAEVLDAVKGKHARLSDELDFHYMLARDAGTRADALAFLGDRFIAEVIGPRQKVLEARRQVALSELSIPGFAALLYGWTTGKSPATAEELVGSKLLAKTELEHVSGGAITWRPGEAARSAWGTPAAMTPLLDLPQPATVTASEKAGYERFARSYEMDWRTYVDPIAIRVAVDTPEGAGAHPSLTADVRILPLIDGSEYSNLVREVGKAQLQVEPIATGGRIVLGVGENADLRRELGGVARSTGFGKLQLDWLGGWAMAGVADRNATPFLALANERDALEVPKKDDDEHHDSLLDLSHVPFYAGIGLKSGAGAAVALTVLHSIADEAAPDLLDWNKWATHRGTSIVRVRYLDKEKHAWRPEDLSIFYALTSDALLLSLDEGVLRGLIDARADGKGPAPAPPKEESRTLATGAPQFALDVGWERGDGAFTALAWALEAAGRDASEGSRRTAEIVMRGAPGQASDAAAMRALAVRTFGAAPTTPDGQAYTLGPDGIRDPARGSASAPAWPALPVPGSPVDKVLSALAHFRGELSFDDEGKDATRGNGRMQSLHARAKLDLRGP
jgi:hypothetical protein